MSVFQGMNIGQTWSLFYISHKLLQQYCFKTSGLTRVLFKLDSLRKNWISRDDNQIYIYLGQRQLLGVVDGACRPEIALCSTNIPLRVMLMFPSFQIEIESENKVIQGVSKKTEFSRNQLWQI